MAHVSEEVRVGVDTRSSAFFTDASHTGGGRVVATVLHRQLDRRRQTPRNQRRLPLTPTRNTPNSWRPVGSGPLTA